MNGTPKIDESGKRYGRLVVNSYEGGGRWLCRCDCGKTSSVMGCHLRFGRTASCGCKRRCEPLPIKSGGRGNVIDMTGLEFGRLTVIGRARLRKKKKGGAYWRCQCECGKRVTVIGGSLRGGYTRSCGCLKRELDATAEKRRHPVPAGSAVWNPAEGRYGLLTAVRAVGNGSGSRPGVRWLFHCACGNDTVKRMADVKYGTTLSCGCAQASAFPAHIPRPWKFRAAKWNPEFVVIDDSGVKPRLKLVLRP